MSKFAKGGFRREDRRTTRAYLDEARNTANHNEEGLTPDLTDRTEHRYDICRSAEKQRRRKKEKRQTDED